MLSTLPEDGQALYRSVLESPEDDAARLIFADWLEENGEPEMAEFIRVQCALAGFDPNAKCVSCDELNDLIDSIVTRRPAVDTTLKPATWRCEKCLKMHRFQAREQELIRKGIRYVGDWSRPFIVDVLGENWLQLSAGWQWYYERGFVSRMELPWCDWVEHHRKILAIAPIEAVELTSYPETRGAFNEFGYGYGNLWVELVIDGERYTDFKTVEAKPEVVRDRRIEMIHKCLAQVPGWERIAFKLPRVPVLDAEQ